MVFYECSEGQCSSLQLGAFFNHPTTEAIITEWNKTMRFALTHLADHGNPVISMDLNLLGGVSPEFIKNKKGFVTNY